MRVACKRGVRKSFMQILNRHGLSTYFAGIHVRGNMAALKENVFPTMYFSNHVSPWDSCILTHLAYTEFKQDPFVMNAEYTMPPLGEWAGAFSVNPFDSMSVTKTLRYSVELLKTVPRCALLMFPQGMFAPINQRPLHFQSGISLIVKQTKDLLLVPVCVFYTFANHLHLEAFVNLGDPFRIESFQNTAKLTGELENRVTQDLDQLSADIAASRTDEFTTIMKGSQYDIYYLLKRITRTPYPPLKSWGMWYKDYQQKDTQL